MASDDEVPFREIPSRPTDGVEKPLINPRHREWSAHMEEPEPGGSSGGEHGEDADHDSDFIEPSESEEPDMSATTLARPPVSTAARMLFERSRAGLLQAM